MTKLDIPGVPNLYDVDGLILRSAQPADSGYSKLYAYGCRSVLDLNNDDEDAILHQTEVVSAAGMKYAALAWNGILPPTLEDVIKALSWIDEDIKDGLVLVHCEHGEDRTGTLCACWRMHHDGWSFERAMQEAFFSLGTQGMKEFWMAAAAAEYACANGKA